MGEEFNSEQERRTFIKTIKESDYEQVADDNPLLHRHPAYIRDSSHNSRDYKYEEPRNDNDATTTELT